MTRTAYSDQVSKLTGYIKESIAPGENVLSLERVVCCLGQKKSEVIVV
ncbi:MAG: hypothetical protein GX799_04935 [Crenarchaeota archaeon]|nr:hypothetical protein [Thermoproteota archaeon]